MIRLLSFLWKESFLLSTFLLLLTILLGIIPASELWVIGLMINDISEAIINEGNLFLTRLIPLAALLIGLMLMRNWFRILSDGIQDYLKPKVAGKLQEQVMEKASSVDLEFYDHAKSYDQLQRANRGIKDTLMNVYMDTIYIIQSIVSIIAYILTLSIGHWTLGPAITLVAIFSMLLKIKRSKQKYEYDYHVLTPVRKYIQYFASILTRKQYAKELRVFGSSDYLISKWEDKQKEHIKKVLKDEKQDFKYTLVNEIFSNLALFAVSILIAISVLKGSVSIGYYVILVQVVIRLMTEMENLTSLFRNNYQQALFTNNLFSFLAISPSSTQKTTNKLLKPLKGKVSFEHVWFKYPSSDHWVIKDLSFTINPNDTVAIVGENGAGKSTIIKLLLGLYQPQKGDIFFDDLSINEIDEDELKTYLSAIFQDFSKFQLTLKESIAIGNIEKVNDDDLIHHVITQSNINDWLDRLDQGHETYLSKEFGGSDLSGGQWQKVALARSLMRDAKILILDEPTSALDPIAELEVFKEIKELSINQTTVLISHRMGSARLADRIIVIDNGMKIEEGSHEELIKNDQLYSTLFKTQAKWYHLGKAGENS